MRAITISLLSAILFTASSALSWAAPEAAKESKPSAPVVLMGVNRIVVTDGKINAKAEFSKAAASAPQSEAAQPAAAELGGIGKPTNPVKYK